MNESTQAADVKKGYVDAHSHIRTRDLKKYPLAGKQTGDDLKPPSFTTEELLKMTRPLGITRVVLIQHKPYHGLDNSYITDAIAENPGVFSAVTCIEAAADDPTTAMDELKKKGPTAFVFARVKGEPTAGPTAKGCVPCGNMVPKPAWPCAR